MPELPEVEGVRRALRRVMTGERIERVDVHRRDLRVPVPADLAARLTGQRVRALRRRAKYLLAELESGDLLLVHLGMSGSFRVASGERGERRGGAVDRSRLAAHDHVVFTMSSGLAVIFNDPRRFGLMTLVAAGTRQNHAALGALGPEPLDRSFTAASLAGALRGKKTTLKAALCDQRVVAGLGNIYACEALHRARLSPARRASTIATPRGAPRQGAKVLADAIKAVLREAIARGHRPGSRDRFRVYDREGQRCVRRGCTGVIRRIVQVGRSTFFCPVCQR